MTDPVDLTSLREITGGDAELEKELFNIFYETSDGNLKNMGADIEGSSWQEEVHSLKGAAANLGANALADIAKEAEFEMDVDTRKTQFEQMKAEYEKVKAFLAAL